MSKNNLSSLILSLQHHEQSLHGIELDLIHALEQAESLGLIPDEKLRSFSNALEQILSIRTSFHEHLKELCTTLIFEETPTQTYIDEGSAENPLPPRLQFQTSPGFTPVAHKAKLQDPRNNDFVLKMDETPIHSEIQNQSIKSNELIGEEATLEPTESPFSLTQPSFKLQEALSRGTTSLDDRLPPAQLSPLPNLHNKELIIESKSQQPNVLPPLMHTPLPNHHEVILTPEPLTAPLVLQTATSSSSQVAPFEDASEALTMVEEQIEEELEEQVEEQIEEIINEPSIEAAYIDQPYITYVPPTPEPVVSSESGGHFEPMSEFNFNKNYSALDQLDELEASLEQLEAVDLHSALPNREVPSSQAQEMFNQRPPRVSLGVRVDVMSDVVRFEAMGHDISTGGIFIETDTPLEPGEQLKLSFELDRTAFRVEVTAQVRWCRLAKDAGANQPVGGGLRFLDLTEQAAAELSAFTAEKLGSGI